MEFQILNHFFTKVRVTTSSLQKRMQRDLMPNATKLRHTSGWIAKVVALDRLELVPFGREIVQLNQVLKTRKKDKIADPRQSLKINGEL
jgi:hypothetical protein